MDMQYIQYLSKNPTTWPQMHHKLI